MRSPQRLELKDGRIIWRVRYRRLGKERSLTLYGPDAEKNADEFAGMVASIGAERAVEWWNSQLHTTTDTLTLDDFAKTYIETLTGITDGTRITYERLYKRAWSPALGKTPIGLIGRDAIARQVNALSKDYSDKTVRNQHGLLAGMMEAAVLAGHIPSSPCKGMRLPRRTEHERVEMRFLDHTEFKRLIDEIPEHYKPLFITLVGTGMRWGEAEALTVGDVDLKNAEIRISKAAKWNASRALRDVGPTKTQRSRRTIALPVEVVDAITPLCARPKSERLFTAPKGGPLRHRTVYDDWKAACERAGLDPHPRIHDLRHTHVAWLIAGNVPLPVIQARLGHESITTTVDRYGHLLPDLQRAAANAASLAFRSTPQISQ
jgi:integrase